MPTMNYSCIYLTELRPIEKCVNLQHFVTERAILRHGIVPESLRDCILVPIPKPGKDPSSSDNYRPIALAPTLSKVFEW